MQKTIDYDAARKRLTATLNSLGLSNRDGVTAIFLAAHHSKLIGDRIRELKVSGLIDDDEACMSAVLVLITQAWQEAE